MNLEELIKILDKDLVVEKIERKEQTILITCKSETKECKCPYCGESTSSIHSRYVRTLSDLPIQNQEVKLLLITRKCFCSNPDCKHKTFSERFDFVEPRAVKTVRLEDYINTMGLRDNSMDTVRNLKDAGINVSSNTVLRIVKKKQNNNQL